MFLTHNQVKLALHTLKPGSGPQLLLLHALGEHSPPVPPAEFEAWPGAIFALDFTGHGASSVPAGGGYTAEVLMADVDAALSMIGRAAVAGRGLGAYIALLIAGARPELVRGAILMDGAGLGGGGDRPGPVMVRGVPGRTTVPDPFALVELASDLRPPDYVARFAELAVEQSGLQYPVAVCGKSRPDWLKAVLAVKGVREAPLAEAIAAFSADRA